MGIKLLVTLPLVLVASVGWGQPEQVGYLFESQYANSTVDVNGTFYYSESNELYMYHAEYGGIELVSYFDYQATAQNLANVNGVLYFTVSGPGDESSLWKSDGTPDGTVRLARFTNTFNRISPIIGLGEIAYFGFQDKIYRSNGTEAGTLLIKDLNMHGDQGVVALSALNGIVYASLRKSGDEYELWKSSGTEAGTSMIGSFAYLEFLGDTDDALFFLADDGSTGREIWRLNTDGDFALVQEIGAASSDGFLEGGNVAAAGPDRILVSSTSPVGVWSVKTSADQLASSHASEIVYADGKFLFITGNKVWSSDGTATGTTLLKTFFDSGSASYVSDLTAVGKTAFFVVNGLHLWQTDGTSPGTILIQDHTPQGPNPAGSMSLTEVGDQLFYFGGFSSAEQFYEYPNIYRYNPSSVWVPSMQVVDASTDEDVKFLENNSVVYTDQSISIRADASLATSYVTFHLNNDVARRETQRPFSLAGDNSGSYNAWNVPVGDYQLRVVPYSSSGAPGRSLTYNLSVVERGAGCGSGAITREYWNDIPGGDVSLVPRDRRPSGTEMLTSFEGPSNIGKYYGARIKGFVCPPETGEYIFWIASNDESELWLSTNDHPGNKVMIAQVKGATNPQQWDKSGSQRSSPIQLESGKQYYIEAWHKQGGGTDHIAVGWQLPSGKLERPIPGDRLSPFIGNQPPEVRIVSPVDGQTFTAPATISIMVETMDTDGFTTKVEIFAGDKLLDDYNHQFDWTAVPAGSYEIYARATDDRGAVTTSASIDIVVTGECSASGTITREVWHEVSGSKVSQIPLGEPPSSETSLSLFEAPANSGANYGARIRGYICPPSTGDYVFWIASNDHSELWLSTDDSPTNKIRIAYLTGATNPRQWDRFSSQQSSPITLTKGKRYYIEALHKQGVGADHVAVGWQLPGGTTERPIAGSRLSPFTETSGPVSYMIYPADGTADIDPMIMKLKTAPVIGARRYTVELNPDADFGGATTVLNAVEDYQTTFIVKGLAHSTTYYVRVKTDISGFGPVTDFTTRDPIGLHRLWGIGTAGGTDNMGTVFSFSIDSSNFVKHYDKPILRYVYGEGEDDYVEYEEILRGTPVAGPDGTLYGQADHDYNHNMFLMDKSGNLEWLNPFVFIYNGNIMLASDNSMYVTTGPYLEGGAIGRYPIDDPSLSNSLRSFNQREFGLNPAATLLEFDGYLYGTATEGGMNNGGVLYRIRHTGAGFEIIHHFSDVRGGKTPVAGLAEAGGFLYGTTANGGTTESHGTIFRIRPDGSEFTKLHDFDGWGGSHPTGHVMPHEGVLYGMTTAGGALNKGVVYRLNIDGAGFAVLHQFSGGDGARPSGGMVQDPDGILYGMTSMGGANDMGVIFKVNQNGSGFDKLFDFSQQGGGRPEGSLIIREDTFSPPSATARETPEENAISISIHPNPSTDNFHVHVKTPGTMKIQMVVSDQFGQTVTSYEIHNDVPVVVGSELESGLYIIKVTQGKEILMRRLVKK